MTARRLVPLATLALLAAVPRALSAQDAAAHPMVAVPDGWILEVAPPDMPGLLAFPACEEEGAGDCEPWERGAGLVVFVFEGYGKPQGADPVDLAEGWSNTASRLAGHRLLGRDAFDRGPLAVFVVRTRDVHPDYGPVETYEAAAVDRRTGTLHHVTFGAARATWVRAWAEGERMVDEYLGALVEG